MAIRSKPTIGKTDRLDLRSGYFERPAWEQLTLFPIYEVSWSEDAPCGHDFCGIDYYDKQFASFYEAAEFFCGLLKEYEDDSELED